MDGWIEIDKWMDIDRQIDRQINHYIHMIYDQNNLDFSD